MAKPQALATAPRRRDAGRLARREQLIKATIACISRSGLGGVTMAEVTREAGLSLGIVNLHFQTKEKLLIEALQFVSDDYRSAWKTALVDGDLKAEQRLQALVDVDFSTRVCDHGKLAVWFAFLGETKSRPTYQRICSIADKEFSREMESVLSELIEQGNYGDVDARQVTIAYSALVEGLWLDMLVSPNVVSRSLGRKIAYGYLATTFNRHLKPLPRK